MNELRDIFTDNIKISDEWLNDIEDYQLKILVLTSVLAENNLAFRGTLKTMCEWLGIKSCTVNNRRIKQSLQNLYSEGYIFYNIEGRTYHVSIRDKGMKNKKLYKIRKMWIEAFKSYNKNYDGIVIDSKLSVDWISILRVFIYIYYLKPDTITTYEEIAKITNTSIETARKSVTAIMNCNLKGLGIQKEIKKDNYTDDNNNLHWITKGQKIDTYIKFE